MQLRGVESKSNNRSPSNRSSSPSNSSSSSGDSIVGVSSSDGGDVDFEQCIYKKYDDGKKKQQHQYQGSSLRQGRFGMHHMLMALVALQLTNYGYHHAQLSKSPCDTASTASTAAVAVNTELQLLRQERQVQDAHNLAEFTAAHAVEIFKTFMLNPPAPSKVPYNGVDAESMNQEKSNSQVGQDVTIDEILQRRRNGFFIEAGAYDGTSLSNSLFFELHRNWTGLLVEANPRAHRELLQKDRKAWNTPACISTSANVELGVDFMASGMVGGYDNARFAAGGAIHKQAEQDPYTYRVQANCFPLNVMLEAIGVHHVDMFSLDVEGVELKVLKAIDFDRITIDLFVIEKNNMDAELRAFMQTKGYRAYTKDWRGNDSDIIFLHNSLEL